MSILYEIKKIPTYDTLASIGVGRNTIIKSIKKWLSDHNVYDFKITDDMKIDTYDPVFVTGIGKEGLPEFIRFNTAYSSFVIKDGELEDLHGFPTVIKGYFGCMHNRIKSLEGGPVRVFGSYKCFNNNLKTLLGCPDIIKGDFDCSFNNIASLNGSPEVHGEYYNISNNELTDITGLDKSFSGVLNISDNPIRDIRWMPGVKTVQMKNIAITPDAMWDRFGMITSDLITYRVLE